MPDPAKPRRRSIEPLPRPEIRRPDDIGAGRNYRPWPPSPRREPDERQRPRKGGESRGLPTQYPDGSHHGRWLAEHRRVEGNAVSDTTPQRTDV